LKTPVTTTTYQRQQITSFKTRFARSSNHIPHSTANATDADGHDAQRHAPDDADGHDAAWPRFWNEDYEIS
jgi:hypothetical protein